MFSPTQTVDESTQATTLNTENTPPAVTTDTTLPTIVNEELTPELSPNIDSGNKYIHSIGLGGEWFLNNQNENFIYYQYNPYDKEHPKKSQKMREMGGLWSITKLAKFLDDDRYTQLGKKGLAYFEETFKYDEENDFYYSNITPEKIKLGYNAFMILAILDLDHPNKDYLLEKFANGIIYQQNKDGSLRTFFYSDRSTGVDYYPGEALVSLMALYEHTKDERYLETVQKAFKYYVGYFERNPNTAFIPWQSRAYSKLYQQTKDQEVADFIFKMSDFMLAENEPAKKCSHFGFPRGNTTSVFMEGVNKGYDIAKEIGDTERATCYSNFIKEGADLMLSMQIMEDDITEQELEIFALGGYLGGKTQRVDRNQHATMALMEAYESGLL